MIRLNDGSSFDPITGRVITKQQVIDTIRQVAIEEGIDPNLALAVAQQESGFDPNAIGDGGHSHGIFQENDMGRGYGRAPDYDVVGQTRRFAAELRQVMAANPGADLPTLGYLAQRPADRDGYIAALANLMPEGPSGGGGPQGEGPVPDTWIPKGPIKKLVKVGTQYQVIYADDRLPPEMVNADQIDEPEGDSTRTSATNVVSANTAATLAANRANTASNNAFQAQQTGVQHQFTAQQNAMNLAEEQRQYNETFGMEKAKFNTTQQFNEAIQKWREAVDSRDYDAQQFWAKRADELKVSQFDQQNADRDVTRGNTLLSLGSRPATLGRYLYALQGKQAPQGFEFEPPTLPGYGSNFVNPTPPPLGGAGAAGPPGGTSSMAGSSGSGRPGLPASPTGYQTPSLTAPGGAYPDPSKPASYNVQPPFPGAIYAGGSSDGRTTFWQDPATGQMRTIQSPTSLLPTAGPADRTQQDWAAKGWTLAPGGAPAAAPAPMAAPAAPAALPGYSPQADPYANTMYAGASGFNPNGTLRLAANDPDAATLMAKYPGRYTQGFADGGVIPEPVVGTGVISGQPYSFGEEGPEEVVKAKKPYKAPKQKWGTNSRALGGTIGYDPMQALGGTGGGTGQSVFNPKALSGYLGGEYLRPGIPNFPAYSALSGGGTSLLPSAQAWSGALPSEQQLFQGFQQDEAGIMPDDALAMMQRMAPRGNFGTPRYGRS